MYGNNTARKLDFQAPPAAPRLRLVKEADDWGAFEDSDKPASYQEKFYRDIKQASNVYDSVIGKTAIESGKNPEIITQAAKLRQAAEKRTSPDAHLAFYDLVQKNERAFGFEFPEIYKAARQLVVEREFLHPNDVRLNDKIDLLQHAYATEKSRTEIEAQYNGGGKVVSYNPLLSIDMAADGRAKVAVKPQLYVDSLRQSRFHDNADAKKMVEDMKKGGHDTSNMLSATRNWIYGQQPQADAPMASPVAAKKVEEPPRAPGFFDRAKSFASNVKDKTSSIVDSAAKKVSSWGSKLKGLFG